LATKTTAWNHIPDATPDPIFGMVHEFYAKKSPRKVNLVAPILDENATGDKATFRSVEKA
jgi:aspartate/tyrosine/aromatic aminotransferase